MEVKRILVLSLCVVALSTFVQTQPAAETTDRNLAKKVEETNKIRNALTPVANTTDLNNTKYSTDSVETTDIANYPYYENCDQYYDDCCCDCWRDYCQRSTYCDPCLHYQPEMQMIRDFMQTMPSIGIDYVDLLHEQSPKLIKFIFDNHEDVKSLIAAAHPYTTAHFMKTVDNFGVILSRFEGRYIETIFVKISNPCQYFLSLPKKCEPITFRHEEYIRPSRFCKCYLIEMKLTNLFIFFLVFVIASNEFAHAFLFFGHYTTYIYDTTKPTTTTTTTTTTPAPTTTTTTPAPTTTTTTPTEDTKSLSTTTSEPNPYYSSNADCEKYQKVPKNITCIYNPCCHLQLRDFIQTMPNIRTDLVYLLYGKSPTLLKYIFYYHEDIRALIGAADCCTITYFMENVDTFGDMLASFEGEYIDWFFGKLCNPCQHFFRLSKSVRDRLLAKSRVLSCCFQSHYRPNYPVS
ncbi:unnamed protein product [Rodentolepis nana]|uniref:Niemann-Pick C1 N-terminal domain-containing protein n=1 Tax=Rodentolepis nana TaxID=102285 RepID=A0A0R3TKP3_RODNA|nr:unnamed protein product [Rodentolepis nana]